MNKIDFSTLVGFPLSTETLQYLQDALLQVQHGALLGGKNYILDGCTGTGTISDGWVVINGEVLPFVGGTEETKVFIEETVVNRNFFGGASNPYYKNRVAKFGTTGNPATEFTWADFTRNDPNNGVLKRLDTVWQIGDVKMVDCDNAYIAANFDGTGLGTNERVGWAICNGANGTKDRRGMFSIAYDDRVTDPINGIWDIIYNTLGVSGGAKTHTLTVAELPAHDHEMNNVLTGQSYSAAQGSSRNSRDAVNARTGGVGGGQAHNNIPPFLVTLFIQKL